MVNLYKINCRFRPFEVISGLFFRLEEQVTSIVSEEVKLARRDPMCGIIQIYSADFPILIQYLQWGVCVRPKNVVVLKRN